MKRVIGAGDIRLGGHIGFGAGVSESGLPSFSYSDQSSNRTSKSNPWTDGSGYNIQVKKIIHNSTNFFYPAIPQNTDALGTWKIINASNFQYDTLMYCYFYVTVGGAGNHQNSVEAGGIRLVDGIGEWASVYDTSTIGTDTQEFSFMSTNWSVVNHPSNFSVYCPGVREVLNHNRLGAPTDIELQIGANYGKYFQGFYEDRFASYAVTSTSSLSGTFTFNLDYQHYRDYKYLHAKFG